MGGLVLLGSAKVSRVVLSDDTHVSRSLRIGSSIIDLLKL